jgi:hypothetical protein
VVVQQRLGVRERRVYQVLGQARSTQRRSPKVKEDEEALREDVVMLARRFGRFGYRMITGMLRAEGWRVNHKRVERIWRQEGLKVPKKQPKRGRVWLNDGSKRPWTRHRLQLVQKRRSMSSTPTPPGSRSRKMRIGLWQIREPRPHT